MPVSGPVSGGLDPRQLWPDILEEVKQRRKVTWIMLDQYAHVAGFDGTTLQLGFAGAGPRDSFVSNGSEDVLRQALTERFHVQWKIEAIVAPAGGGSAPQPAGGPGPRPGSGGSSGYGGGGYGGGHGVGGTPTQPAPAQPVPAAPSPAQPSSPSAVTAGTAAEAPAARPPAPEPPPPVAPEDDIPEDDDPDLDESALSGQELIVRELGATVVEEYTTE
ncbi:DNA polymerase III subunit gamma/tau [Streptomyces mexicanus]|uniref:DNA polymerase III subunit gamma/tau n=1 Tax=Streptomyces mexicanus TaxID=178566 RepID=UPI0033866EFF